MARRRCHFYESPAGRPGGSTWRRRLNILSGPRGSGRRSRRGPGCAGAARRRRGSPSSAGGWRRQRASLLRHAQPTLYRGPAATAGRPASRLHRLRRTPCSGCGRTRRRRPTGSPGLPGARCERPSIDQAAGPGATLDAWDDRRLANVSAAATSRSGVPKQFVLLDFA